MKNSTLRFWYSIFAIIPPDNIFSDMIGERYISTGDPWKRENVKVIHIREGYVRFAPYQQHRVKGHLELDYDLDACRSMLYLNFMCDYKLLG